MKKVLINVFKYILFLGIGVFIFWKMYRSQGISWDSFKNINYFWIVVSTVLSLLSQVSRAMRWNMLIEPLGYKPKLFNTFLSVLVLYLVNLIIPRAGEIGRCTVLSKYEKIPFAKLVGTVFVERLADLITLLFLAVIIISSQFNVFRSFFITHENARDHIFSIFSAKNLIIGSCGVLFIIVFYFIIRRILKKKKGTKTNTFIHKLKEVKYNIFEGIKTISKLKNKWYFIGHTFFIFLMWLFMFYVIFLAFEPTAKLSIVTGAITFLMGGLAMLLPVQGGLGAWHFMVMETLFIYGISKEDGKIFALVAHTATNLIYIFLGLAALLILFITNRKAKS